MSNLDNLELEDVYGIWKVSFWSTGLGIAVICLAILSLLAISAFFVWLFFFKKRKISSWGQAFIEFNKLINNSSYNFDDQLKFYEKTTEIFKNILVYNKTVLNSQVSQESFRGLTDSELIEILTNLELKDNNKTNNFSEFKDFILLLKNAEQVKFAKKAVNKDIFEADKKNIIPILDSLKLVKSSSVNKSNSNRASSNRVSSIKTSRSGNSKK